MWMMFIHVVEKLTHVMVLTDVKVFFDPCERGIDMCLGCWPLWWGC